MNSYGFEFLMMLSIQIIEGKSQNFNARILNRQITTGNRLHNEENIVPDD